MNSKYLSSQGRFKAALLRPRSAGARMVWVITACSLVTLLAWPLRNLLHPANIAMLYLLAVAVVAMHTSRSAAIATAFLSTALLDFFFTYPRFSFTVAYVQHVVTLAVMLVVALIIANLTLSLQRQTAAAVERERQSRALYLLASQLAGATSLEQMAITTRTFPHQTQGCRSVLLVRRNDVTHIRHI